MISKILFFSLVPLSLFSSDFNFKELNKNCLIKHNLVSCMKLGDNYKNTDMKKALKYYNEAKKMNSAKAYYEIGKYYIKQNSKQQFKYGLSHLEKAAKLHYYPAAELYAKIYLNGNKFVRKSPDKVYKILKPFFGFRFFPNSGKKMLADVVLGKYGGKFKKHPDLAMAKLLYFKIVNSSSNFKNDDPKIISDTTYELVDYIMNNKYGYSRKSKDLAEKLLNRLASNGDERAIKMIDDYGLELYVIGARKKVFEEVKF